MYFGAADGSLHAIHAAGGGWDWALSTGAAVTSSPAVANGVLYFGSQDGTIRAHDANTGSLLWDFTAAGPVNSSPAVANGYLYAGSNDRHMYAFTLPAAGT